MKNKKLFYNRILFFIVGVGLAAIFCVIFGVLYDTDSELVETDRPESHNAEYLSNDRMSGIIPDSVLYRTKWLPVGVKKIANFYRVEDKVYWSDKDDDYCPNDSNRVAYSDANSFMIAPESRYAKDKRHVYWVEFRRDPNRNVYYYLKQETCEANQDIAPVFIVWDADPASFVTLGYGFACDKNKMYFVGKEIDWDNGFFNKEYCRQMYEDWKEFVIANYRCDEFE